MRNDRKGGAKEVKDFFCRRGRRRRRRRKSIVQLLMRKKTYGVAGHGRRKLFDDASPKRLSFPLGREEAQFFALLVGKGVAVADLIVVGRQLLEELSDPVTLADGVDVGHFVFGQGGEVQMHLNQISMSKSPKNNPFRTTQKLINPPEAYWF